MAEDRAIEFDCVECGQHIVDIVGTCANDVKLCGRCLMLPGWYGDPRLRKYLEKDPQRRAVLAARHAEEHRHG